MESFTPGVADRLGIGYTEIDRLNPRIIYCSVSGFGQTGPYSQRPAYDPVIQAMSGLMATTGEPGRPPVRVAPNVVGLPLLSWQPMALLLAVIARGEDGQGPVDRCCLLRHRCLFHELLHRCLLLDRLHHAEDGLGQPGLHSLPVLPDGGQLCIHRCHK